MKNDVVVAVLATAVGLLGALLISAPLLWVIKYRRKLRRKSQLVPVAKKRRRFSHLEVVNMTDHFRHVVGLGGFGTVYRGVYDGAPVAVKLYRGARANQGFESEVNYLNKVYHKNLINLVGYCEEPTQLASVFEFMANGDLRKNLTGKLTMRSDMYGFGVVLMEIITGKPAFELPFEEESFNLRTHWVSSMFGNGDIEGIVDPKLEGKFDINSVEEALKIAISCVSQNTHDRPEMDEVIVKLKSCLQMERARLNESVSFNSTTLVESA